MIRYEIEPRKVVLYGTDDKKTHEFLFSTDDERDDFLIMILTTILT